MKRLVGLFYDYDWGVTLLGGATIAFILLAATVVFAMALSRAACLQVGSVMGIGVKWTWLQGCYVQWHGQWFTYDMFKAISVLP